MSLLVVYYKYTREREVMTWLKKLIFACVSKTTQIREVVAAVLRKQVHHVQGENCSSKIKRDTICLL